MIKGSTVAPAALAFILASILPCISHAADWPQFQGPARNAISSEKGLLREWPAGGPTVLWRTKIGQGWNSPAVAGDNIVLSWTDREPTTEVTACINAASGKERWRYSIETGEYWVHNVGWAKGGVRATATITDKLVYAIGVMGHVTCLDRKTGKVVWQRDVTKDWVPAGEKGLSFSPVLEDGRLILYLGDGTRTIPDEKTENYHCVCIAVDPMTGKDLWTYDRPHVNTARCGEAQTPAVATFAGEKCVLFTGNCALIALRISDGKEIWNFDHIRHDGRGTTMPTPLVMGNRILNIPDLDVTYMIEVDWDNPVLPSKVLWKKDFGIFTQIQNFVYHEGYLYGFHGQIIGESEQTASDSVLNLSCIDAATGEIKWTQKGFRNGASLTLADGLLFVRSYQKLQLVEATPTKFIEKGKIDKVHKVIKMPENLTDFVMPVLSNGKLYIRTPNELICYKVTP